MDELPKDMENCTMARSVKSMRTIGKLYTVTVLMEVLEKHGQKFKRNSLADLMVELPDGIMIGPLSAEDIEAVFLKHSTDSSDDEFEFCDWAFVKADKSLRDQFRSGIIKRWTDAGYVETGLDEDGKFTWKITIIDHGESFDEFSPKVVKLLSAAL